MTKKSQLYTINGQRIWYVNYDLNKAVTLSSSSDCQKGTCSYAMKLHIFFPNICITGAPFTLRSVLSLDKIGDKILYATESFFFFTLFYFTILYWQNLVSHRWQPKHLHCFPLVLGFFRFTEFLERLAESRAIFMASLWILTDSLLNSK